MISKCEVLVLGATGQLGKLIAENFKKNDTIKLRVSSRKPEQFPQLRKEYGNAIYLDLDDPRTFADALKGVDRLFLLTGYSYTMLVQSKALVDAAKKAGIKHIVHLGVFTPEFDCYDSTFAWHQIVEAYIKVSGIPYTFLHPNTFMQNLIGSLGIVKNGKVTFYIKEKKVGWVALEDVAAAAAQILIDGPSKHSTKEYWFSTESLNIPEVAKILSQVTGNTFIAEAKAPEEFLKDLGEKGTGIDPFFLGLVEFCKQVADGRMSYMAE